MTITIIGTGLLGGSFALSLKKHGLTDRVIGVDAQPQTARKALELGVVDEVLSLDEAVAVSDLVVVAVPVDALPTLVVEVLNKVARGSKKTTVIDLGSTKGEVCELTAFHVARGRFVATHPMWGTEHSGPEAAVAQAEHAFAGRTAVVCQKERSADDAVVLVEQIYTAFGMPILYMDPEEHDTHAAYVSHISHITSFALALTVLEKEREDSAIFSMAGGGFESTVRLAKSSASMWLPIFLKNKYNVLDVLRENIHQLKIIQKLLETDNRAELGALIERANTIKNIIK